MKIPWEVNNLYYGIGEYLLTGLAKQCGILVPEYCLLKHRNGINYFAAKRFDRSVRGKLWTVSLCTLLNKFFRFEVNQISDVLMAVKDKIRDETELFKLFQLICFCMKTGNTDLNTQNISFIYDPEKQSLQLAPAYDLSPFRGIHPLPKYLNLENSIEMNFALLAQGEAIGFQREKIKAYIIKTENILNTYQERLEELSILNL